MKNQGRIKRNQKGNSNSGLNSTLGGTIRQGRLVAYEKGHLMRKQTVSIVCAAQLYLTNDYSVQKQTKSHLVFIQTSFNKSAIQHLVKTLDESDSLKKSPANHTGIQKHRKIWSNEVSCRDLCPKSPRDYRNSKVGIFYFVGLGPI